MSATILKLKLKKDGDQGIDVKFKEFSLIKSTDTKECEDSIHPHLKEAVNGLRVHLAILTNYLPLNKVNKNSDLEKFKVTGYSLKEKEEGHGIVITGYRGTDAGGVVILNSPFTMVDLESYTLAKDLEDKLEKIEFEVNEYLFKGKKLQPDLFEEDTAVTNMKIDTPDETGMSGEGKEFTAGKYREEFDKTATLRKAGKVVPIKKGKKTTEPVEETVFTPQTLEKHLASRKKNPGGKPRAEKPAVRKNPIK